MKTMFFFAYRLKSSLLITFLFVGKIVLFSQNHFHAELTMNDRLTIPFDLEFLAKPKTKLTLRNGNETIHMRFLKRKKDSLYFEFPEIAGELVFHRTTFHGYWKNLNKALPMRYPFHFYAAKGNENARLGVELDTALQNFSGTYEVQFTDSQSTYPAVGIFYQTKNIVQGTFRTETGDYRFLSGGIVNGTMRLSCFDGVHAFLFEATKVTEDSLSGEFYSGSRYHAHWVARRNDVASLTSPYSFSFPLQANEPLNLLVKNTKGKTSILDSTSFSGAPTVIQVMGTWCPNCLDETKYFIELHGEARFKKVRFIMVAFENGTTDKDRLKKLKAYIKKIKLNYPAFLGGEASTKSAHKVFHQLNGIFSFPTTLFLDKTGRIVKVHAGFDGPGTGAAYERLKEETEQTLIELLK